MISIDDRYASGVNQVQAEDRKLKTCHGIQCKTEMQNLTLEPRMRLTHSRFACFLVKNVMFIFFYYLLFEVQLDFVPDDLHSNPRDCEI